MHTYAHNTRRRVSEQSYFTKEYCKYLEKVGQERTDQNNPECNSTHPPPPPPTRNKVQSGVEGNLFLSGSECEHLLYSSLLVDINAPERLRK